MKTIKIIRDEASNDITSGFNNRFFIPEQEEPTNRWQFLEIRCCWLDDDYQLAQFIYDFGNECWIWEGGYWPELEGAEEQKLNETITDELLNEFYSSEKGHEISINI